MPIPFNDSFVTTANAFILDSQDIKAGLKRVVATVADLEQYQTFKSNIVEDQSLLVYVQGGDGADGNSAQGFWFYDTTAAGGVAEENDWGWVRFDGLITGAGGGLELRDGQDPAVTTSDATGDDTPTTVQFIGGDGLKATDFTNVTGAVHELTFDVDFTNTADDSIIMANSDNDGFTDSGISYDTANGYSFSGPGSSSAVTIGTLNVTTLNAGTSVTNANLSTSDTFIRIADPSTFTQLGTGEADQSEFANAVSAGFVVNTGYYDDDASDNTADPAYSTHKLLYWDSALSEWLVRDGDPNGGATDASDRFEGAESNFVNGTAAFLRNFYANAKALHFGLDTVFSFDHFGNASNPGTVTAGNGTSFMKTEYVPTVSSLRTFEAFFDPDSNESSFYSDFGWDDDDGGADGDDDAANTMANTEIRYARVIKAKVTLEGNDIDANSSSATIKVYHGGIFGNDSIPVVRVYAQVGDGADLANDTKYQEIMCNVTQGIGQRYVEITFNPGYLTTSAGTGNVLHVRMVG